LPKGPAIAGHRKILRGVGFRLISARVRPYR
jgi:hypothetical protein